MFFFFLNPTRAQTQSCNIKKCQHVRSLQKHTFCQHLFRWFCRKIISQLGLKITCQHVEHHLQSAVYDSSTHRDLLPPYMHFIYYFTSRQVFVFAVKGFTSLNVKITQKLKFSHHLLTSTLTESRLKFPSRRKDFWSFTAKQRRSLLLKKTGDLFWNVI